MHKRIREMFEHKRVCILGLGREGTSTYRYLRHHFPLLRLTLCDRQKDLPESFVTAIAGDPNVSLKVGDAYLAALSSFDVVMKTPGIPSTLPEIIEAQKAGAIITSQTSLFLCAFGKRVIGITGTKGKSTTSTLLLSILTASGVPVRLVGNIERPVFDVMDEDSGKEWYIYELSSHQLSDVTASPHIAVFLNFYKEHMDYYHSLAEYWEAKTNIARYQTRHDVCIYNQDVEKIELFAKTCSSQTYGFSLSGRHSAPCRFDGDTIYLEDHGKTVVLMTRTRVPLLGRFNITNVMAAALTASAMGVRREFIEAGVTAFKPLSYRLEHVGTYRGIEFYDDALATIPEAAAAAVDAFEGSVATLLAGGYDRGQDFTPLAKAIIEKNVEMLILFPTTGERLETEVKKLLPHDRKLRTVAVSSMEQAVRTAYANTPEGKLCLLSAGAPSFGMFDNYKDRSDQYRRWVREVGNEQ